MAYSKNRRLAEIVSDTSGNLSVEGLTVPTQSASDSDTSAASTAFVTNAVDGLVDSAPGTLNTLNEIAAALNDDANFNTTVTNAIAAKLPLAGGTLTGTLNVTQASTADTIKLTRGTTGHNNMIKFVTASSDNWIVGQRNDSTDHFRFYSYGTSSDVLSIQTDGKVGIGTASPSNKLHLKAGASGASSFDSRYNLTIEDDGENYIGMFVPNNSYAGIRFLNAASSIRGYIDYYHGSQGDKMQIYAQNQIEFGYPTVGIQHVFKADGNVGIGDTNPTALRLSVVTPTANHIGLQVVNSNTADSFGMVVKGGNDANDYTADFRKRDNTNIMRIRGDGNVGIGTTSPEGITSGVTSLSISDAGAKGNGDKNGVLAFKTNDASYTNTYSDGVTAEIHSISESGTGAAYGLGFVTGTITSSNRAERVRISATGDLLVGTAESNPTSSSVNVAGQAFSTTGGVRSTVASNPAATFNRKTDNGDIAIFRKDGSTIGSIGVEGGDSVYMQGGTSSGAGLLFHGGAAKVLPVRNAASIDATIDLGQSSRRFKDLHLSGYTYSAGFTTQTSMAGIGVSQGDVNAGELGPGYITLSRDDTANADQILLMKNGNLHTKMITVANQFKIHHQGSDIHLMTDEGGTPRRINFSGSIPSWKPFDSNTTQIDLGTASGKWKDLYLSGGIYLGGTGAVNKLDDYEEGTLTMTNFSNVFGNSGNWASNYAFYTKIGNLVHIQGRITFTIGSTGQQGFTFITPIAMHSSQNVGMLGTCSAYDDATNQAAGYILDNTGGNNNQVFLHTNFSSTSISGVTYSMTYRTA